MRQQSDALKQTGRTENSESEYRQANFHNNVNEDATLNEVSMESQSFIYTSHNKEVKVTLSFPIQSDKKAEQEFTDRLKEIYLNKIQIGSIQSGGLALQSQSTDKSVGLDATKEEKRHE